jgi:dihydroorotate dehydrogenase electron transfer subunit
VIANARLSRDYSVLSLAAPEVGRQTQPGQFVMVKPAGVTDPLLRRPFSVFEVLRNAAGEITGVSILNKRAGRSTRKLYELEPGDVVSCLGPLGMPFKPVAPPTEAWMVAGGVGLAPFATLGEALVARGTKTTLFYGARSGKELFYLDWFAARGIELKLATEDGTHGDKGRVTLPLERELQRAGSEVMVPDVMVYACGPEPMLEAVAHVAEKYGRPSQVSVERVMGCGMGGCYSCVIPVKDAGGGQHYVRSCIGGPVFNGAELVWD